MTEGSASSELNRSAITDCIRALPDMGPTAMLSGQAASAACFDINHTHRVLADHIGAQVDALAAEVADKLDGPDEAGIYHLNNIQLRGVLARAVISATGQTAIDIGRALQQIATLEGMMDAATETPG
jgi:hypothetical protein